MNDELLDFIRSYREPVSIDDVAKELESLGKAGASWPIASAIEWHRELMKLVDAGQLRIEGNVLSIVKQGLTQGELF
jgi:hypothetical protein